jgi:hypothetical protein
MIELCRGELLEREGREEQSEEPLQTEGEGEGEVL